MTNLERALAALTNERLADLVEHGRTALIPTGSRGPIKVKPADLRGEAVRRLRMHDAYEAGRHR